MRINSRYVYVFSIVLALAILVSSAAAAENMISYDFGNEGFSIDVPSGSDFIKEASTNLDVGDVAMNMSVFENNAGSSDDVSAVAYIKDMSSNQNIVDDAVSDLKKEGAVIEENDKYFVVETKNSNNWDFLDFDIGNDIDSLFSFADGLFSSDSSVNVSGNGADVQISSADGINVVDDENTTVSISGNGLHVSDANGEDVSISTEGIKVSGESSSDDGSDSVEDVDVSLDGDMLDDIGNDDYVLCIENPDGGELIIISGNNLDLLKSMAETASFD